MSLSFILRTVQQSVAASVRPMIRIIGATQPAAIRGFHSVCDNRTKTAPSLLRPLPSPLINAACGMKTKGRLNLRCRGCYFVVRKGRRYVMCKEHPRHKQQQIVKKEEHTWIMTHFTNGKRAWPRW